jgi:hypothetical protein
MIQIEYTFEGLDEAIRDIEAATMGLPEDINRMLSEWGGKYLDTAKAYPFPKADRMRSIDGRLRGVPRFRDFWKSKIEPTQGGAVLDIWNEHQNAKFVLFPTSEHQIPYGGAGAQREKGYPLRWYDSETGAVQRAWSVWHPGTPGQPVHQETWLKLEPELDQELDKLVEQFTKKVGGL